MIDIKNIKGVYFIGIGGIGMSALARYFRYKGLLVAGYDRTPTPLTKQLSRENIEVSYICTPNDIPTLFKNFTKEQILVVYTPAIQKDNTLFRYFKENKYKLYKRAKVLGFITQDIPTIAVAGSHGKTSISVMISWIMKHTKVKTTAFLGGISKNLNSNFMLPDNSREIDLAVVEADEFDRSFLHLSPNTTVVGSIDADHLDIYENKKDITDTFAQFVDKLSPNGRLIIKKSVQLQLLREPKEKYTYSLSEKADFYAENIKLNTAYTRFDLVYPSGKILDIKLNIPGKINVENAVAASAAALLNGASEAVVREALASWQGTQRRFEYVINKNNLVFINDYAHHPKELKALISSVKELYPQKKLTGIFQPHLYSRTRDFASDFAHELSKLDEVILTPIYPAREKPIKGVCSEIILKKISHENKYLIKKDELTDFFTSHKTEVLLLIGAGNICDMVKPLEEILLKKEELK